MPFLDFFSLLFISLYWLLHLRITNRICIIENKILAQSKDPSLQLKAELVLIEVLEIFFHLKTAPVKIGGKSLP